MALARGVDVCVLAIVRDELVVVSEWDADEEVKSSVHSKEVHREVEVTFVFVGVERGDTE